MQAKKSQSPRHWATSTRANDACRALGMHGIVSTSLVGTPEKEARGNTPCRKRHISMPKHYKLPRVLRGTAEAYKILVCFGAGFMPYRTSRYATVRLSCPTEENIQIQRVPVPAGLSNVSLPFQNLGVSVRFPYPTEISVRFGYRLPSTP